MNDSISLARAPNRTLRLRMSTRPFLIKDPDDRGGHIVGDLGGNQDVPLLDSGVVVVGFGLGNSGTDQGGEESAGRRRRCRLRSTRPQADRRPKRSDPGQDERAADQGQTDQRPHRRSGDDSGGRAFTTQIRHVRPLLPVPTPLADRASRY